MSNRRVMIAIRDEETADGVLNWYRQNVMKPGDNVLLVHVANPKEYLESTFADSSNTNNCPTEEPSRRRRHYSEAVNFQSSSRQHHYSETVDPLARHFIQRIDSLDIQSRNILLVDSSPAKTLIKASEENSINLLVLGCSSQKRTGFWRKSVTNYILRNSTIPVIVEGSLRKISRPESILSNPFITT